MISNYLVGQTYTSVYGVRHFMAFLKEKANDHDLSQVPNDDLHFPTFLSWQLVAISNTIILLSNNHRTNPSKVGLT